LCTALFTIVKLWKQPICPITDDLLRKCGIYTQKRMKSYHSQEMDGTEEHDPEQG
jgi:hypothetical protein